MCVWIRHPLPEDRPSIEAVVADAFSEPVDGPVARMLHALDQTNASRVDLVAIESEAVVGHVRLSRGWIDARERLVTVLILSPLAVVQDHQGRGIGTKLLAAALAEADELGAPAVFLEGSWNYYGARGFTRASDHAFDRPSRRIPAPAFQVALGASYEPWMRGGVVYPEAFWLTDAVGLRDPELSEVERRVEG